MGREDLGVGIPIAAMPPITKLLWPIVYVKTLLF